MIGMMSLNERCFVLCLNHCIPSNTPNEPPSKAIIKNVLSLVLHLFFFAFCLSLYIRNIETTFTTIIYETMNVVATKLPTIYNLFTKVKQA